MRFAQRGFPSKVDQTIFTYDESTFEDSTVKTKKTVLTAVVVEIQHFFAYNNDEDDGTEMVT